MDSQTLAQAYVPDDCLLRLKASALDLGSDDSISYWPDLSGNGNDAWQDTVAQQPSFETVAFAGKTFPVARFDSVDDGMATPAFIDANAPFSIFVLWRPTVIGIEDTYSIISSGSLDWSMGTFNGGMLCYFTTWTSGAAVNANDFFLFEVRIVPGAQPYAIYLNGVQCGIEPNAGTSGPEQLMVGASGYKGYPAACDCAEVIIYERFLSDAEADGVRAYFQEQYNYLKL